MPEPPVTEVGHGHGLADALLQGVAALLEGRASRRSPRRSSPRCSICSIFSHVLEGRVTVFDGRVGYTAFLVPGLVMMSVLQNAFANSSSSLIQSQDHRQPDLRAAAAAVAARPLRRLRARRDRARPRGGPGRVRGDAAVRAVAPGACRIRSGRWRSRCWAARSSARWASSPGISADKFDQLAAFQNFIIVPLTFLSGVFYSIHSLPPFWQTLSHLNPFFYMIDGFRYGFFGVSDVAPLDQPGVRRLGGGAPVGAGAAPVPSIAAGSCAPRNSAAMVTPESIRRLPRNRASTAGTSKSRRRPALRGAHRVSGLCRPARESSSTSSSTRALGDRMREEIHALSMQTLTPEQWAQRQRG